MRKLCGLSNIYFQPIPSPENSRTAYRHDIYDDTSDFYFLQNSKVFQWENLPTKRIHYEDIELDMNRMTEKLTPAMAVGKTTVRNWSKMRQTTTRSLQENIHTSSLFLHSLILRSFWVSVNAK